MPHACPDVLRSPSAGKTRILSVCLSDWQTRYPLSPPPLSNPHVWLVVLSLSIIQSPAVTEWLQVLSSDHFPLVDSDYCRLSCCSSSFLLDSFSPSCFCFFLLLVLFSFLCSVLSFLFFPSFCHYFFIFFLLNSFPPHFVLSSPSFFCDSFPYSLHSIPSYFPLSFLPSIISFFSFIPSYWPCSLPVFLFFPELTVIIHFYDFIFISISFFSNMFCFFLDSSLVPSLHLLFSQLFLPVSMLHWPECDQHRAEFGWIERQLTVLSIQIQWYCKTRCGLKGRISFVLLSIHVTVCSDQSMSFCFVCSFFNSGTIVSVGDPKKKYTRFEKIGQGWVINPSCISSLLKLVLVPFHLFVIFTLLFMVWITAVWQFSATN